MKRLLFAVLAILACVSVVGCSRLYDYQVDALDHFDIGYSEKLQRAFVASYHWDGADETKRIVIPDEYNGMRITELGGYYGLGVPCYFGVEIPKAYLNALCPEASQWFHSNVYERIGSVDTVYLSFDLHIGKNIEEFVEYDLNWFYEGDFFDGQEYQPKTIIVLLYYVTCDEANETFYAKDGKLYRRQDDQLVSDIFYYDFAPEGYRE